MSALRERLRELASRLPELQQHIQTEEATKTSLVMPVLQALGYDVFNPSEVVPELTADVGTKQGEKIDFCLRIGGKDCILIEVKACHCRLSKEHFSQLYRYFSVSSARFALLTNGIEYWAFSDLNEANKLDMVPFLELSLRDLKDRSVIDFSSFSKEKFDVDGNLGSARDLKYTKEVRRLLESQVENPDEAIVKFFFKQIVPEGSFNQSKREQFTVLVARAWKQLITDRVTSQLQDALATQEQPSTDDLGTGTANAEREDANSDGIVTTEEELDGFRVVKAIAASECEHTRIGYRDAKSYFAVLLDDNNRKTVCRLYFNGKNKKHLGIMGPDKQETKYAITSVEDIYKYAREVRAATRQHIVGALPRSQETSGRRLSVVPGA